MIWVLIRSNQINWKNVEWRTGQWTCVLSDNQAATSILACVASLFYRKVQPEVFRQIRCYLPELFRQITILYIKKCHHSCFDSFWDDYEEDNWNLCSLRWLIIYFLFFLFRYNILIRIRLDFEIDITMTLKLCILKTICNKTSFYKEVICRNCSGK